jgi:hypothetical protein
MRLSRLASVVAAAALVLAACAAPNSGSANSTGQVSTVPAPVVASAAAPTTVANPEKSENGLTAQVIGTCSKVRGESVLRLKASGFTPNGTYRSEPKYPNGTPYTYLRDIGLGKGIGQVAADGSTPDWTWDCADGEGGPDTPGVYTLTIRDLKTNRTVTTTFTVIYPKG